MCDFVFFHSLVLTVLPNIAGRRSYLVKMPKIRNDTIHDDRMRVENHMHTVIDIFISKKYI